jgi:hypothetical protein
MRTIILLFFGMFFMLYGTQCKRYKANALPQEQLRWGSGGGYTGIETTFVLLKNGQKFSKIGQAEYQAIEGMKRSKAKSIYKTVEKIDVSKLSEGKASNKYNYLELPDGKGGYKRIVFSALNEVPKELLDTYMSLEGIKFVPPVIKKDIQD